MANLFLSLLIPPVYEGDRRQEALRDPELVRLLAQREMDTLGAIEGD